MNNFKFALGKFLTGEFEFAQLVAELDKELASHPDAGPELQQLLKNLYGAGRLPQQLYEMLMQRTVGVGPGQQAGGQPGRQTGGTPGPLPPDDDDGKTQLRARPPVGTQPVPDNSATQLRPPGAQPGQTGQFGQPGQPGQPGQTGQFRSAWADRSAGSDRPVRSAGSDWSVRPAGSDRPIRSAGSDWSVQPAGSDRPVRSAGSNRSAGSTGQPVSPVSRVRPVSSARPVNSVIQVRPVKQAPGVPVGATRITGQRAKRVACQR